MRSETRHFLAGDIIFREGDDSNAAWVIESGRVELVKSGATGSPMRLSILGRGDLFGESGVLDNSARNFTARADTDVILKAIPRSEFLKAIQTDPAAALKVMTQLAKRQRDTDERLVRGDIDLADPVLSASRELVAISGPPASVPPPGVPSWEVGRRPKSFLGRLARAFVPGIKARAARRRTRTIMVTPLSLEAEYDQRPYLIEALTGLEQMAVKPSSGPLFPPVLGMPAYGAAASQARARRMLEEEHVDVLVWGGETGDGRMIELRFCTATLPVGDRPGGLPPDQVLIMPADFDARWAPLLKACVLTAFANGFQPLMTADDSLALVTLTDQAADVVFNPPEALDPSAVGQLLAAYGYVAATAANCIRRFDLQERAAEAWRSALALLSDDTRGVARLSLALGMVVQGHAEKSDDESILRQAVQIYRNGLREVRRDDDPQLWGRLQYRVGTALFRLDLITGDDRTLREALLSFRDATGVINRADDPWRWSEAMHAMAQALQVWGDHNRNIEVLGKAVDLCRVALEVRTPEAAPHLFAATRNNMGSALFLMAKYTSDPEFLRLAAAAFRDALAVYRDSGGRGRALYTTIEKNLQRAEDMLRRQDIRPVAAVRWAEDSTSLRVPAPLREEDDLIFRL